MRLAHALALLCLIGCANDEESSTQILLAGEDGSPSVVGTYEHGELVLDADFARGFDLAVAPGVVTKHLALTVAVGDAEVAIDPASHSAVLGTPLASGDTLGLVVSAGNEAVDQLLLVAGQHPIVSLGSCDWSYRTTVLRSACRTTVEYWKRSSCTCTACWQRFGSATWSEGC